VTSALSIQLSEMEDITLITVVNGLRAKSFLFNAELIPTKNDLVSGYERDGQKHVLLILTFNYPQSSRLD
jgi:hypothetical protein